MASAICIRLAIAIATAICVGVGSALASLRALHARKSGPAPPRTPQFQQKTSPPQKPRFGRCRASAGGLPHREPDRRAQRLRALNRTRLSGVPPFPVLQDARSLAQSSASKTLTPCGGTPRPAAPIPVPTSAVLNTPTFLFCFYGPPLSTAPEDHRLPTATNRQPPTATNRQPPPTANVCSTLFLWFRVVPMS